MNRVVHMAAALALLACDDRGSGGGGGGGSDMAGDAHLDAAVDMTPMVELDAAPPEPTPMWSRLAVEVPVRDLATRGESAVIISEGGYAVFGPDGAERVAQAEYTTPIAAASNGDRVALLFGDAFGVANPSYWDGGEWVSTDIFYDNARGIDVAADGTIRMPKTGGVVVIEGGVASDINLTGIEDEPFHIARWFGEGLGEGWLFGEQRHFILANAQYNPLPIAGPVIDADAHSIDAAFALTETETHWLRPPPSPPITAPISGQHVVALDTRRALVAGSDGELHVLVVDADAATVDSTSVMVASDSAWSALHAAADGTVWLGTEGGFVYRYGLDVLPGWEAIDGDPLPAPAPPPEPMPDAGVDMGVPPDMALPPDAGPPPPTSYVRWVGFATAGTTYVCADQEQLAEVGEWRGARPVSGYAPIAPGEYALEEEVGAAGRCRGLGLDEFTLRVAPGSVTTVIVGVSISLSATILRDDLSHPGADARLRVWGLNRSGSGRLEGFTYCVNGVAVEGGDRPNQTFDIAPGPVTIELRRGDCAGELHYTLERTIEAGETRSLFTRPGTMPSAPALDDPDLYWIDCLDALNAVIEAPSPCRSGYVRPPVVE